MKRDDRTKIEQIFHIKIEKKVIVVMIGVLSVYKEDGTNERENKIQVSSLSFSKITLLLNWRILFKCLFPIFY